MVAHRWIAALLVGAFALSSAWAQGTTGPRVSDSTVGYIDNAIPGDIFRLRFDAAYDFTRATRAEFFYARPHPLGPGLPRPEPRIDYQDLSAYLEIAPSDRLSAFVELPWRFLNPEVNANANGFSDKTATVAAEAG